MAIKINIDNDYSHHAAHDASNWRRELYLEPGDEPCVNLVETYGNGTPEPAWNSRWLCLGSLPQNVADASEVVAYLESEEAQDTLQSYLNTYRCEWDGHNHVGCWGRAEDEDALAVGLPDSWPHLQRLLEDCPTYWDASDWFQAWPDDLTAETTDEELETMAPREVEEGARDQAWLDESDVLKVLTQERNYRREKQGLPDGLTIESAHYALDGPIEQRIHDLKHLVSRLDGWATNEADCLRDEATENLSELES